MKDEMTTIEELESILATPGNGKVEIKPDGSIHYYKSGEPREHGPVRILTATQALGENY